MLHCFIAKKLLSFSNGTIEQWNNDFLLPFSDFLYVLRFWAVYFVLGIIALPFTFRIFSKFVDRGYIFSKVIGTLILTFVVWFLAVAKIYEFSEKSVLIILLSVAVFSIFVFIYHFKAHKQEGILQTIQENKNTLFLIFFEEIVFFFCLYVWSYVRGFQPIIEGLEKYMDFGFINAILNSGFFPPKDMWLSGYTINYYYFGHLIAAILSLISRIPPEVIYNLMIAVIFAFCFTCSFSIGINIFYNLSKTKVYPLKSITLILVGLLTAYLVTNAANLQPVYHLLSKGKSTYWYPDATRFIVKKSGAQDETIHEFPHYSFVVADLHGHVSSIPNVLLVIAILFVIFNKIANKEDVKTKRQKSWLTLLRETPPGIYDSLVMGFFISTAYMTNAMDGPLYFGLMGLAVFGALFFKTKNFIFSVIKTLIFSFFSPRQL